MKKSLSILLTSALAVSMLSSGVSAAGNAKSAADFTDLQSLDAASKAKFDAMIAAGVFNGIGETTFGLNDKMNRAQFAKVAALVLGLPVDASLKASSFSDVSADDPGNGYALPYIEALKKANLTDGVGANRYNPAGEVTKEQLAAFWMRGLHKEAEAQAAVTGASDGTVSDWAKGYAALAVRSKLMDNSAEGSFQGTQAATRAMLVYSSYEAKRQTGAVPASAGEGFALTNSVQAQVKGVLQEKLGSGWRFGAVVKFTNTSGSTIRVPDYDLRAKTSDGTVYTLQPSADNPRSIAPQSFVQLSFIKEVDQTATADLTNLLWIDVDNEVYPKQERTVADVPAASLVWHGADAAIQDASLIGNWGAAFTVPGESSTLSYTATNLNKQFNGQEPTYVIRLKVENKDRYEAAIPDFTLSGKSEGRSYIGKRVEPSPVSLKPGEQKYIHFAITADPDANLTAFYVLSNFSFMKQGANAPLQFYTGKIGFKYPDLTQAGTTLPPYELGKPIAIDALSKAVNPKTEVSLQSLDWFENEGQSFKTAVAKVKFANKGDASVPVPQLGAEMISDKGTSYSGTQLAGTVKEVHPGLGAVGTYAFTVPKSEASERFTFRLLEPQGGKSEAEGQANYTTPISQVNVKMGTAQADPKAILFALYPYRVTMDSMLITYLASPNPMLNQTSYIIRLQARLKIEKDEVLADASHPKLYFELEDFEGRRLATKTSTLSGDDRLRDGSQFIEFQSTTHSVQFPLTVKVYEAVGTPQGDAIRFLTSFKNY